MAAPLRVAAKVARAGEALYGALCAFGGLVAEHRAALAGDAELAAAIRVMRAELEAALAIVEPKQEAAREVEPTATRFDLLEVDP